MDLFEFDNVKSEKGKAMIRYRRLRKLAKVFRLLEVCIALIFLSWFSTRLPNVVHISGKYFKDLSVILISPGFVFLVGNAIVLTLFAKSGQFSGKNKSVSGSYLYEEFVKNSETRQKIRTGCTSEEVVFQDKEMVVEEISTSTVREVDLPRDAHKKIHRSQSENIKRTNNEKPLRRSVTAEKCGKVDKKKSSKIFSEEEISDEEFNRKIEEFIARQVKFHKEESMAIVLQNH